MKQTHNINLYRHKYEPIFTHKKRMITYISYETARKKVRDDKDKKHKNRVCYSDTKQIEKKDYIYTWRSSDDISTVEKRWVIFREARTRDGSVLIQHSINFLTTQYVWWLHSYFILDFSYFSFVHLNESL